MDTMTNTQRWTGLMEYTQTLTGSPSNAEELINYIKDLVGDIECRSHGETNALCLLDTTELQYKNQITSLKEEIEDLNGGIVCIEEERGILEDKYEELKEENKKLKESLKFIKTTLTQTL